MNKYLVWCPELGSSAEDGRQFAAFDAEGAACMWARWEDAHSADYWIVQGQGTTVIVRSPDGSESGFKVTGESDIHYSARPA